MDLTEKLKKYTQSDVLPMHMPGHKRNIKNFQWLSGLGGNMDITEIPDFDNLNEPTGVFAEMNDLAAKTWGADCSISMVNGSTGAILASVWAVVSGGEDILIARNCHKSVYNAAEICGSRTYYLVPEMDSETGIWGSIDPKSVEDTLKMHPGIRLVVITSPTYEGVISDICGISEICHRYGVPLLVDEAHGAHLGFGGFPEGAVKQGADIVIQSLHKTLPSLTQTAVIHLKGNLVSADRVRRCATIFQSSSPSYILSSSMDGCIRYMSQKGEEVSEKLFAALKEADSTARDLKLLRILCRGEDYRIGHGFYDFDPSKIVIITSECSTDGPNLAKLLRNEYRIETEMSSREYVIAMTGLGDSPESIGRLCRALKTVDEGLCDKNISKKSRFYFTLPEQIMSVRDASNASQVQEIFESSEGKISSEYIWIYPPGSPILIPGEKISRSAIESVLYCSNSGLPVASSYGDVPNRIFCTDCK